MFDDEPDNANIHQPAFNEVSSRHFLSFYRIYILTCLGDNAKDVHDGNQAANDDDDVQCPLTLTIILQDST